MKFVEKVKTRLYEYSKHAVDQSIIRDSQLGRVRGKAMPAEVK